MTTRLPLVALLCALGGCNSAGPPIVYTAAPAEDPLYSPQGIYPGRLEYAPDRSAFAPVLTHRGYYPTQDEAQAAWLRAANGHAVTAVPPTAVLARPDGSTATGGFGFGRRTPPDTLPVAVRLFGCGPGRIDNQTGRTSDPRRPLSVLCATDFLDAAGGVMFRSPVNFVYAQRAWHIDRTNPPAQLARWFGQTRSPKDPLSWVPGRPRYE
ncbi:MAG: hypothetical protein K2Y56_23325 [Methylobacterium sp.]|jgi:hypothetical protein|uniref:hypothetical protein n=1 Tax=Methylobacterium sp. TaxID=409 RepID=UPI0025E37EDB|nr:hypothetical protein [Methylobacterium sp.]MBX9934409.1 hypothetical protein [Methylobacterium sp.]